MTGVFLRAAAVTRGWDRYRNKSQHIKEWDSNGQMHFLRSENFFFLKLRQRSIKLQLKGQHCMGGTAHCTHRNMQSSTARLKNAVVRSAIIFIEYVTGNTLVTQSSGQHRESTFVRMQKDAQRTTGQRKQNKAYGWVTYTTDC